MKIRRMLVKLFTNMSRNPLKKCTGFRVVCLLLAGILCWSVVTLMSTSQVPSRLKWTIGNSTLIAANYSEIKRPFVKSTELPSGGQAYLYDDLVKENPIATYFNDKLRHRSPVGKAHLELTKPHKSRLLKSVLIFLWNTSRPSVVVFAEFFARQRIEYKFRCASKELPPLVIEDFGMPRYSLIVFDDYATYANMAPTRRDSLDNYCKFYNIGMLVLTQEYENMEIFSDKLLLLKRRFRLTNYKLNPESEIWRVAKSSQIYFEPLPSSNWAIFVTTHKNYRPLVLSSMNGVQPHDGNSSSFDCVIAVHDQGLIDGIQRIIIGHTLDFWLNVIVATDAITFLTNGLLGLPLTRLLQVDIDDVFVGDKGIRTLVKDAKAMFASQQKIREHVPGFIYNLGFSGYYYMAGNTEEQAGDRQLLALAHHFRWFDHLYQHNHLLKYNATGIRQIMKKNAQFAQEHNIPMTRGYMVPPYHMGVYPVYELLYDAWFGSGVFSTSTMEYPKESPVWGRRGFIYRDIMVLPRLDCNLYTMVNTFDDFPGGQSGLDRSIWGGLLFKLFLHIPVMIFMTHMSNYANDQLGQYSFENVVEFVTTWTNLKLTSAPPEEIARRYFEMYPNEVAPVWTNPCEYNSKHLEILPPHVICSNFPKFFILGTENSGTAILQTFLELHPNMMAIGGNVASSGGSNFFSGDTYLKGLHWYQNRIPQPTISSTLLFESSNVYFADVDSPQRIHALVPNAKILILLSDPVLGAHACYQRLRLQADYIYQNLTLVEALRCEDTQGNARTDIRKTCLHPRAYAIHLTRWLQFIPANLVGNLVRFTTDDRNRIVTYSEQTFQYVTISLIDVDQLYNNPTNVLFSVQRFLNTVPYTDLAAKGRYNWKSRCFYQADNTCLKPLTDDSYDVMDDKSRHFLQTFFMDHNSNLKIILKDIHQQQLPYWLSATSIN